MREVGRLAVRWFDRITDASYFVTLGLLMFLALSIGANVLLRRVFDQPIGWVVQGGQYTLVYITFFSATRLLRQGAHTRMTLLSERLEARGQAVLSTVANSIAVLICAVLVWQSGAATWRSIQDGAIYRGNFDIARALIWWVIPVGFAALALEFIRHLLRDVEELRRLRAHHGQADAAREAEAHRPGEQGYL
jgi:TRAP-type C4-dicarboxylate transport system permease small subunit